MRKKSQNPVPGLANRLLSKVVRSELHEEFLGDLKEAYESRVETYGKVYATFMYWVDVIHLLLGFSSFSFFRKQNPAIMTAHYLHTFRRNLARDKSYSFISILSLSVGMGVCLVICQYIYFELSYDRFHDNYKDTYRVIIKEINTELKETSPSIGYLFGLKASEEIPEIKQFMRKQRFNRGAVVTNPANQSTFHEEVNDLLFVDHSFFEVFNFPFKTGDQKSVFDDKFNIVITEQTAKKYFGTDDPIGKTLKINGPPSPGDYTVTGVLRDLPLNSHLQFDFLVPIENYIEFGWGGAVKERGGWNGFSVTTYLKLDESADLDLVRQKLNRLLAQHNDSGVIKNVILQPVADIYMKSNAYSDAGFINSTGDIQSIRIFSIISFIILLVAWANYINLSTARCMLRAKEVGVRKSIGALRKQLISQFIFESLLVNVISAFLAIGLAFLLLPFLTDIIGKQIQLSLLQNLMFWVCFFAIILFGSLLSGLYPAFVLSSFRPINMLSANKTARIGPVSLRKGLIAFQFLTSILFISGTYLVYKQTVFMKYQELDIDLDKILVLRSQQTTFETDIVQSNFNSFRDAMLGQHMIAEITSSTVVPGQFGVNPYRRVGQPESATPYSRSIFAGLGFSETYGLKFIAGSPFTEDMPEGEVVIINESAIRAYGFDSPHTAIQQKLMIGNKQRAIVGVVENFSWHSLKEPNTPYVISLTNVRENPYISLRMNVSDISTTLSQVESIFHSFYPDHPFEYFFAEDSFNRQYQSEVQFGKIFSSFAALATFIACAGLFALVSFSATLKVKEIGIRKVLGADVRQLVLLLSREIVVLISLATFAAIPVIWYWGNLWLSHYATRIHMGVDLFVTPVIVLIAITALTVGYKTFAAARANPVDSLRKE